jgi:hypothetical protein
VWQRRGGRLAGVEALVEVGEVLAQRREGLARDLLPHQVRDQQPQQRLRLQWRDRDRRGRPFAQRVAALIGERVDGARAGAARLLARLEIAQLREPFRLDGILALARPVQDAAAFDLVTGFSSFFFADDIVRAQRGAERPWSPRCSATLTVATSNASRPPWRPSARVSARAGAANEWHLVVARA